MHIEINKYYYTRSGQKAHCKGHYELKESGRIYNQFFSEGRIFAVNGEGKHVNDDNLDIMEEWSQ